MDQNFCKTTFLKVLFGDFRDLMLENRDGSIVGYFDGFAVQLSDSSIGG